LIFGVKWIIQVKPFFLRVKYLMHKIEVPRFSILFYTTFFDFSIMEQRKLTEKQIKNIQKLLQEGHKQLQNTYSKRIKIVLCQQILKLKISPKLGCESRCGHSQNNIFVLRRALGIFTGKKGIKSLPQRYF